MGVCVTPDVFGFKEIAPDGTLIRYRANDAPFATITDIREAIGFSAIKMPLAAAAYRKNTKFKFGNRPYFENMVVNQKTRGGRLGAFGVIK